MFLGNQPPGRLPPRGRGPGRPRPSGPGPLGGARPGRGGRRPGRPGRGRPGRGRGRPTRFQRSFVRREKRQADRFHVII